MKICWDNLEGVYLSKGNNLKKGTSTYVYKESCTKCGESYLTNKYHQSKFCGLSCGSKGENNPFFGKTHTIKVKKEMSKTRLGSSWSNHNYMLNLSNYKTYSNRLKPYEGTRKRKNTDILEVKCAYCGFWFAPDRVAVKARLKAINNLNCGEQRLYCSEHCKLACPTYGKIKYPRGFKHTTSREVSTYLRQLVLERDNWTCQICGKTIKEAQLHVHHMDPVAQNPMFQNDVDSCITLCKGCHKMVHSRIGCRYVDLQCKKAE